MADLVDKPLVSIKPEVKHPNHRSHWLNVGLHSVQLLMTSQLSIQANCVTVHVYVYICTYMYIQYVYVCVRTCRFSNRQDCRRPHAGYCSIFLVMSKHLDGLKTFFLLLITNNRKRNRIILIYDYL
jgi:hypothetical protein